MVEDFTYHILEDSRALLCIVPSTLSAQAVKNYFQLLIEEKEIPHSLVEHVDLTATEKFEVDFSSFDPLHPLYSEVVRQKIVYRLIFYVSNSLQFGMARMFSGVVSDTGIEYEITYDRGELEKLYQQLSETELPS